MNERELFAQAIEIQDTAERAEFLDRVCLEQPALRAQLARLLQAHDQAGAFLDQPVISAPAVTQSLSRQPSPAEVAGTVIAGKYRLLQPIGEGGMGSVWMADQLEPVKRRVAVKLIRTDRDGSRTILSRFEAERQAIALMDHQNIAKLLDAGTTGDAGAPGGGRPFFIMELVKGTPLTEFCDEHRLSISRCLSLFLQICSAVQHAHQKGIIHRDLKPSNILVELHDDRPVPKVIDFGLAKALSGQPLTEHTLFTGFGTVAGTPLYMAPEQARFNAIDIDTRADIYALGVILYELLTGSTPIERAVLQQAALDEILRVIRESEPPTPSKRLSSTDSKPSIAANRQSEPQKLGRFIKGELDWIAMKALAKERERRYETANGLAKDIERFLNHEPVLAGPPSAAYRLRKLVQRNRGQVVAAGLLLLALVAGMAGTTAGLIRAEQQRRIAQANERKANRLADAEREAKNRQIALRAKAERARDRTWQVLGDMTSNITGQSLLTQPEVSPEQKRFLNQVLTYYQEFAAEEADDETSRVRIASAAFNVAQIEDLLGRKPEALRACQMAQDRFAALAAESRNEPKHRRILGLCRTLLGKLFAQLGEPAKAEAAFGEAIAIQAELVAKFANAFSDRQYLALSHHWLGNLLRDQKRLPEANAEYSKALAIRQVLADESPDANRKLELAGSLDALADLLKTLHDPAEAERSFRAALDIREKLYAEFPSDALVRDHLADSHISLGSLFHSQSMFSDASDEYRLALGLVEKLEHEFPASPEYQGERAMCHYNLGNLAVAQQNWAEAEREYLLAVPIQEKLAAEFPSVSKRQIDLGGACCNLGNVLKERGRVKESLNWYAKAIRALSPVVAKDPWLAKAREYLFNSYKARANAYAMLQKHREAVNDWTEAITLGPPQMQPIVTAWRAFARADAGQMELALDDLAELTKSQDWGAGDWLKFACMYAAASAQFAEKREEYARRAIELLREAVKDPTVPLFIANNPRLNALREREDFKAFQAELSSRNKANMP